MSYIAIKVKGISKAYRIGLKEQRHDTLGATIASWVKSPFRNFKKLKSLSNFDNKDDKDIFWALKDINFEVKKGEVLGIIGKNGAGKSTLLKILSRISEPTDGKIEIYGRVASLLEVGTGFNPELTGRENVYLNGTILGMTKKEIDVKFDEIIGFSGIEKFIDTPVKRYSSGMKVRLAFAVAAHLEPEILIIDEVLAVGDAEFQNKCMGKMNELSKGEGRTVLFVSHNMAAVKDLCSSCILLSNGRIIKEGITTEIISYYHSQLTEQKKSDKIKLLLNYENSESIWGIDENVEINIYNLNIEEEYFVDLAFYDQFQNRLFSIEGSKFKDPLRLREKLSIKIINPGIVNSIVSIDVGLKKHFLEGYEFMERGVLEINTVQISNLNPINGIIIPKIITENEVSN